MNKNKYWKCAILLAGIASLSAQAVTSTPDARPHPEDFSSYSLYLQALFDFQRAQTPTTLQNSARSLASDNIPVSENLDDAIANAGSNPGYIDTSTHPRSTFKSFALAPIPTQDMSQNGIEDALGIFGNHELEQPPTTTARLRPDNDLSLTPNVDMRLIGDAYDIAWTIDTLTVLESFSGYIALPEGEASASASVTKSTQGDHGLDLTLSARVRSNIYMIDRDGMPGSRFSGAGAVAIQPLSLQINGLTSHITAIRNNRNQDLIAIQSGSPNAIILDLSGSRFGVADAENQADRLSFSRNRIGNINYFAGFGQNALVTIAPGMSINIKLGHPDGMRAPLATVNGKIPTINIGDLSLLGRDSSSDNEDQDFHIGNLSISGLDISNLRLFINKRTVVIDMGTGSSDLSISMERVAIGPRATSSVIGDFYVGHIGVANTRISIAAH